MNKINNSIQEDTLILECVHLLPLGPFWDGIELGGQFWRLYYHDAPGASVRIRNQEVFLLPDHVYLIPPAVDEIRTKCKGTPRQLYIHFELPCLPGGVKPWIVSQMLTAPLAESVHGLFSELERDLFATAPRTRLLALSLAAQMVALLPESLKPQEVLHESVSLACEKFRRELAHNWSLAELAKQANMAPNAFLRLFRENTGLPPYQYLLRLRYARAARLLESTRLPIEEICSAIGISDRFHFSRVFHRIHGIAPAAYRRVHQSKTEGKDPQK